MTVDKEESRSQPIVLDAMTSGAENSDIDPARQGRLAASRGKGPGSRD